VLRALCVDELGPIAYDNRAADRLFESGLKLTGLTSEKQTELASTVVALRTAEAEPRDPMGTAEDLTKGDRKQFP
jgi:hypothetical protein